MLSSTKRRTTARKRSTARKPAQSRKPAPKKRAKPRETFEGLDQRHYDLAGLGLIAMGVFLAFVTYMSWDGGRVGSILEDGLTLIAGRVSFIAPVALAAWGVALVMRPVIKAPSAINAGAVLVLAGLLLAFAAGTTGLGPTHPLRHGYFQHHFITQHGGGGGEALYWAATTLFQRLGAHILAVLMLLSGALLLTGTTISDIVSRAARGAQRAGTGTREIARSVRTQSMGLDPLSGRAGEEIVVTRANPTEPLITQVLGDEDDTGEIVWDDDPRELGKDADEEEEPERSGEMYAYDEATQTDENVPPVAAPGTAAEAESEPELTPMGVKRSSVTESEEIDYAMPAAPKLLEKSEGDQGPDMRDREAVSKALLESLKHFGVDARLMGVVSGPHVSRYELQLAPGTKVSKVAQLRDDLAYALASTDIRILAPIPGKKAVGVEVPNARRRLVRLGDIYGGRPKGSSPLAVWLGKDVSGQTAWTDLALMPHALVAGTTGSGKSACVNSMLCSILLHASPNDVRLVLVDPKRVELNHYERLPHLLTPVVTNPRMAANVLGNLIGEMESRYGVMEEARARNLVELNRVRKKTGRPPLPHILCVIDELADLMMVAPADVEDSVIRLAQKSRAVGIHLVLATQRPSTDVITGTIKVNIPARIAFSVASQVDSRVILDQGGAETLLGQGDMLFRPVGTSRLQRIQGGFVTEEEIAKIVGHWARQGEPEFDVALLESHEESLDDRDEEMSPDRDDLLDEAARIVVESGTASVSMIQRRLRVGYTRAGRLIDMLERRGIISGYEGSKPRQVLASGADLRRILGPGDDTAQEKPAAGEASTDTELEPVEG